MKSVPSLFIVIIVAIIVGYVTLDYINFGQPHPPPSSREQEGISLPDRMDNGAGDEVTTNTRASAESSDSVVPGKNLIRSIYDAERNFRDAAIAAVDKEMTARRQTYPDGWLRWEPVWIDPIDITNGDYLNADSVAQEFMISPFPDRTYQARRTVYIPRENTASATWEGVLDGGKSGKIKITILKTEVGIELRIRLRTSEGHFTIMPTELQNAYVAAEANGAYWMESLRQRPKMQ